MLSCRQPDTSIYQPESYAYIKRFLAVTAPEMPISGFVNRIIDEHLKKYEHEMSKLYTECITKPL